ncbi:MAG: hypothetical protein IPM69_07255 [Ignavibacteria bacterium]|nr:hypothetical protein [Ignavibacteria bacterium]
MKSILILFLTLILSNISSAQWLQYDKTVIPSDSLKTMHNAKAIVTLSNGDVICGFQQGIFNYSNGLWDAYPIEPQYPPSYVGSVVTMVKDSYDNLWVATSYGLKHYDTKLRKMTNYYNGKSWAYDSSTFSGNNYEYYMVKSIAMDSSGGLWLTGMSNATAISRLYDGKWTSYTILKDAKEFSIYAPAGEVGSASMEIEKNGTIWYVAYGGIVRFDPKTGNRTLFDTLRIDNKVISFPRAGKIHIARDGKIWMNAQLDYILNFDPKDSVWTVLDRKEIPSIRPDDAERSIFVTSAAEDNQGNLWVTMHPDYLAKYNKSTKKWLKVQLPPGRYADQGVGNFLEYGLTVDKKGQVWVGTRGEGVVVYTGDASSVEEPKLDNALAHTWIFSVVPNPVSKSAKVGIFADPQFQSSFHVGLYSMLGTEVLDVTKEAQIDWDTGRGNVEFNVGHIAEGMYLLRVSNGGDNSVSLLTVAR